MFIERTIVKNLINKKENISFEQLIEHFTISKPPPQDGLFTASDFADECMRITEGACEDSIDLDEDPLHAPVATPNRFNDYENKILLLKNGK